MTAEEKVIKLRKALVGLVGLDDPKGLKDMEGFLRLAPVPDQARANMINAIHVLMEIRI